MKSQPQQDNKTALGLFELIAIALGGMIGGGIFSILGISVQHIGNATPIAILIGGVLAMCAAYSYAKLTVLYKDAGATYSFFKRTFPKSKFASSVIGWFIVFGYISTLALYAFTFSSYFCSVLPVERSEWLNKIVAGLIIAVFAILNLISVKGMGKVEDWIVYTKVVLLLMISALLASKGSTHNLMPIITTDSSLIHILMITSITFVAYEGFQLAIHAYQEAVLPAKNIPRAIYSAVTMATILYVVLAIAALATIPKEAIIADKEYALAAGSQKILGSFGFFIVIFSALLATSSAISGTIFGASRLMAVIAEDGYFPKSLGHKIQTYIPDKAIVVMCVLAFVLILSGGLQVILEFGSITFIIVSFLMAYANFKKRKETNSHVIVTILTLGGLFIAGLLIFYFEYLEAPRQLLYISGMYLLLIAFAYIYSKKQQKVQSA